MGEQEVIGGVLLCVRCESDSYLVLLSWWHGEPHCYSTAPVVGVFVSGGFGCKEVVVAGKGHMPGGQ